jgi:hypothetical protein
VQRLTTQLRAPLGVFRAGRPRRFHRRVRVLRARLGLVADDACQ